MKFRCIALVFLFNQLSAHITRSSNNISGLKNLPCMSAKIINNLFLRYKRTFSVRYDENSRGFGTIMDVLDDTFLCLNTAVPILLTSREIKERKDRFLNYIITDDSDSVGNIISNNKASLDHTGFYVISLVSKNVSYQSLTSIFSMLRKYSIMNVVVLYENTAFECEAWTYSPFVRDGRCNYIDLNYLGKFENIPLEIDRSIFFPKKANNLRGCPLIVGAWQNAPYMILSKNCTGHIEMNGIQGNFFNYMAAKRNFTIEVKEYENDNNPQGIVYQNGTSSKALKWIQDHKVNVSTGAYSLSSLKSGFFSPTYIYMTDYATFIVPVGRPISYFKAVFLPFKFQLWIALATCFLLAYLLIFIIQFMNPSVGVFVYGYRVRYPVLNLWNVAFGGTLCQLPKKNFARFILMQWILLLFVLRTGYLAQLFKQQQRPPATEQITTLSDSTWKEGYTVYSDSTNYNIMAETSPEGNIE